MKTTRIQFNAKSFKANRDVISAYFGATYDLAIELDRTRKATKAVRDVIAYDKLQLTRVLLGFDTMEDGAKITRKRDVIEKSLAMNTANYNEMVAPYNALATACEKALTDGVALFDNKDSVLYKAYAEYVLNPTDDNYNAYAKAMADKFVEMGLTDATADNVVHYMPNADRALRGTTAVKKGKIVDALTARNFAQAVLRKIYDNNADAFRCDKFIKYVEKCKADAKNK